jgi:pilus assembly protein FimV
MLRKLAIAIAASGAMMSATYVHALGMGDIELKSALNQPLDAHIKLIKAGELENWEIKPDLASSSEFQKSGIEHVFFLNNVKFEVERVGGDVFIKLSTNQPVVEPFLNFLVQVDWPSGRLLREYTLLLDPPVFSEDDVQSISAPVVEDEFESEDEFDQGDTTLPGTGTIDDLADLPDVEPEYADENDSSDLEEERVSEKPVQKEMAAEKAVDKAPKAKASPQTYKVRPNDTLWEVALRTRPNRSISPQQAMLALQDLNPDAFIGGNINRLKKNQVLRVPDEEQIRARGFKESISEVAIQNQFLSTQKAQLDATSKSQAIVRDDKISGAELKLLAGGAATTDSKRGASGEVMAKAAGDQSKLDNELSLALEDLDKSKRDSLELSARLDLLEDQIKTLQRIISLKDEQMLALQAGFAKTDKEQNVDPRQVELDTLAAKANDSEKTDLNFADPGKAPSEDEPKTSEAMNTELAKKPAPKLAALPDVVEDQPFDAMAFAMENPPLLGGVLGALMLALFGVNFVRKRKEKQAEESVEKMSNFEGLDPLEESSESDAQLGADFDDEFSDLEISGEEDLSDDDLVTRVDEFGEPDVGLPDDLDDTQDNTDVLGEVEIYIAYDRFDQARGLLEKTLQSQPTRIDLRIKLMEVLAAMDDKASIAPHFDYVVAQGSEADQEKASQFREDSNGLEDTNELDMDDGLGLDTLNDSDPVELEFEINELGDGDLNFDLDGLGLDENASATDSLDTLELDSENSLEFETSTLDDVSFDLDSANDSADTSTIDLDFTGDLDSNDLEFDLGLDDELRDTEGLDLDLSDLDDGLSDGELLEALDESLDGSLDELGELEISLDSEEGLDLELPQDSDAADLDVDASIDDLGLDFELDETDDISFDLEDDLPVLGDDNLIDLNIDSDNDADLDEIALDLDIDSDLSDDADLDAMSLDLDLDADSNHDAELDEMSLELDIDADSNNDSGLDEISLDIETDTSIDADLDDIYLDLDMDLGAEELPVDNSLQELDNLSKELDAELLDFDNVVEADSTPVTPEAPEQDAGDLDLSDLDADLDFLSGTDESETKLDLARAYIDMDDKDGAKEILQEVLEEGTDKQKQDASNLLDTIA